MNYETFEAITILAVLLAGGSFFMALAGLICWFFGLRDPKHMATYSKPRGERHPGTLTRYQEFIEAERRG